MRFFGSPNIEKLKAKGKIKRLIKALNYEKDLAVREAAGRALGKMGWKAELALMQVVRNLENPEPLRLAAAKALGEFGFQANSGGTLIECLQKEENIENIEVWIRALVNNRTAKALISGLEHERSGAKHEAIIKALVEIDAIRTAIDALKEPKLRDGAKEVLMRMGPDTIEPLICSLDNGKTGGDVAELLQKIGPPAVEPLISHLVYRDIRMDAAQILEKLGSYAVEPLIKALAHEDRNVRKIARETLGKIGDIRAVEPLIKALDDADWDMREITRKALMNITDSRAVEAHIKALEHENYSIRESAAEALGKIRDNRAVEPLIKILNDNDDWVRTSAAEALGEIGDIRAVEPLIKVLEDRYQHVRTSAAEALGKIRDSRAIESLKKILIIREKSIQEITFIAQVLNKHLHWTPDNSEAAIVYFAAMRRWDKCIEIGAPAVESLIFFLKYGEVDERINAARALGSIGEIGAVDALIDAMMNAEKQIEESRNEIKAMPDPLEVYMYDESPGHSTYHNYEQEHSEKFSAELRKIEKEGEVIRVAAKALESITGKHLDSNSSLWQEWWKKNKETLRNK
ncbi:MAG: HEAT repeat domain-containing protein [Candidatus Aminicenantes bacterium]|nr:HEAT repeat domain-containing protein [Candidatus Aminicenantes bacterium]